MGSEQFKRHSGLKRTGEGGQGDPRIFTVIGVDIPPDKLIKLYEGTHNATYASDVIRAAVQRQRTKGPPPAGFVTTLRGGVEEPIIVCDLNADAKGKSWMVVVEGRQRTLGLRILNDEAKAKGHPAKMIPVVFRPFARKTAGLDAEMCKVVGNCRVPRSVSQRAEDAQGLALRHVSHEDIAPLVEARDANEVVQLLALAECTEEVQEAVNSGKLALAACVVLAQKPAAEQVRLVKRKLAPSRKAADEAAPAKPRARNAKLGLGFALEAQRVDGISDDARAVLKWHAGDDAALDAFPALVAALTTAKAADAPST